MSAKYIVFFLCFLYIDKVMGNVTMPYDADEPVIVKDQAEQFRKRECDKDCLQRCFDSHLPVDCEYECGCA